MFLSNKLIFFLFLTTLLSFMMTSVYAEKVHYAWVGNLNTDVREIQFKMGPENIANFDNENIEVFVWVSANIEEKARQIFSKFPKIQIMSVDSLINGDYDTKYLNKKLLSEIKKFYDEVKLNNLYVAQKDIISHVIVYEFGGYFFDTNTYFLQNPALPEVTDLKVILSKDDRVEEAFFPWNSDVWAFASNKGNKILLSALKKLSFIRAQNDILSPPMYCDLIPLALRDINPNPTTSDLQNMSYEKISGGDHLWEVPSLGLYKVHSGSWRPGRTASDITESEQFIINTYKSINNK